jgi:hypothetical protein
MRPWYDRKQLAVLQAEVAAAHGQTPLNPLVVRSEHLVAKTE